MAPPAIITPALQGSPLAKLAPETRNEIWKLVLTQSKPIAISDARCTRNDGKLLAWRMPKDALAVTATCKQINSEALPIFFATNTIKIHTPWHLGFKTTSRSLTASTKLPGTLRQFMKAIRPRNVEALREVHVRIPHLYHDLERVTMKVWKPLLKKAGQIAARNRSLRLKVSSTVCVGYHPGSGSHYENVCIDLADPMRGLDEFVKKMRNCTQCAKDGSQYHAALFQELENIF